MEDYNIINNLETQGPSILDKYYSRYPDQKNQLVLFEKLYISDQDIFQNGLSEYINYIVSNSNINLWVNLINLITPEELFNITINIFNQIKTNNNKIKLILYQKIFIKYLNQKNILDLLSNLYFWKFDNNSLLGNLLNSEDNIPEIFEFIHGLIHNKNLKKIFIDYISDILNKSIAKIHEDINNPSDIFIFNILKILLLFWEYATENPSRLSLVDPNYIIYPDTPINWYDKKNITNNSEPKFITQIFFLLLNSIRIGYIPILYRLTSRKNSLVILEKNIAQFSSNPTTKILIPFLTKEQDLLVKGIQSDSKISDNLEIINKLYGFYSGIIAWLKINIKYIPMDDIFSDFIYFLNYTKKNPENFKYYNLDFLDLIIDIILTKNYTKNIELRNQAVSLFLANKTLEKNNGLILKFFKSLFILHNDVDESNINLTSKYSGKIKIYNIIEDNFLNNPDQNFVKNLFQKLFEFPDFDPKNTIKKFINIILMDLSSIQDTLRELFQNYKKSKSNRKLETGKSIYSISHYYYTQLIFFDKLLNLFIGNTNFWEIINSGEIYISLINILNITLKKLAEYFNWEINIIPESEQKKLYENQIIDMDLYIYTISSICSTIFLNKLNLDIFPEDNFFDLEYYKKIKELLNLNNNSSYGQFIFNLENIIQNKNTKKVMEYPPELLDPLAYIPISEPILLPNMTGFNSDLFFEKSVIIKGLLIKEENPYTRAKLTISELENFNNLPNIKNKLELFKKKILDFKG